MIKEVTDANIQEVLAEGKPVVVDFWAPWCGPCKMMLPVVEELAAEYEGKITVGKLNVDENDETCSQYGIMNIPTILFFKNGIVVSDDGGGYAFRFAVTAGMGGLHDDQGLITVGAQGSFLDGFRQTLKFIQIASVNAKLPGIGSAFSHDSGGFKPNNTGAAFREAVIAPQSQHIGRTLRGAVAALHCLTHKSVWHSFAAYGKV